MDATINQPGKQRIVAGLALPFSFLVASLLLGCSGEAERAVALRRANLETIANGYVAFHDRHERSPRSAEELSAFLLELGPKAPAEAAIKSLNERDIVVLFNGELAGSEAKPPVLAFEAPVPGSGGYLVDTAGKVQLVSAATFDQMQTIPVRPKGKLPDPNKAGVDLPSGEQSPPAPTTEPTPSKEPEPAIESGE